MNMSFFIILGLSFLSFIIPAVWLGRVARKGTFNQSRLGDSSVLIISSVLLPLSLAAYFLLYQESDFVGSYKFWQPLMAFGGTILIALCGHFDTLKKYFWLVLLLCVISSVAAMPEAGFPLIEQLSPLGNKILIAVIWFVFAAIYRFANNGNGLLASQSATVTLGIAVLGTLNAIPMFLGAYGWMFTAALLALTAFSWYPTRIKITDNDASAFGFMLFSLIAPVSAEGAGSCCVIFAMYFLIDFAWALLLKLTFLPRFDDIYANSALQQAIANGMNPAQAATFTLRIQMLMLLFGCFQIYSPTPWSLLFISTLIAIWLVYRFRNIFLATQSLKDINAQVLEELQDRVDEFKNYIKKDENL